MDEQVKVVTIPLNRGIVRNTPFGNAGEMEDMVNCVYRDGAYRPVKRGKLFRNSTNEMAFDRVTYHITAAWSHGIGIDRRYTTPAPESASRQAVVYYLDDATSAIMQTIYVTEYDDQIIDDVVCFKNYIIILSSRNGNSFRMLRYLYNAESGLYYEIRINTPASITMIPYENRRVVTEGTTEYPEPDDSQCAEVVKGQIYKLINEASTTNSELFGAVSYRTAYRLADGSFFMPSIAKVVQSNYIDDTHWATHNTGVESIVICDYYNFHIEGARAIYAAIMLSKWKATANLSHYSSLVDEKNVIQSVCIFMSKPIVKYDLEKCLTNEWISSIEYENDKAISDAGFISTDWTSKSDLQHYLVAEIPISKLVSGTGDLDLLEYFKLESFYQNYATREALTVDQWTHHDVAARSAWIYNARLWLTGFTRTLATPAAIDQIGYQYFFSRIGEHYTETEMSCKIAVRLNIDGVKQTVTSEVFTASILVAGSGNTIFYLPTIYYPDSRAIEIVIYLQSSGVWKTYANISLTKSAIDNYSYYFDITTDRGDQADYSDVTISTNPAVAKQIFFSIRKNIYTLTAADTYTDNAVDNSLASQVQLSALNNPLVFPSNLSYLIGTGSANYFATFQDVLSEGQFGQFPVLCATSAGWYALQLGTDEIVVQAVTPLSPVVCIAAPLSTNQGIFFTDGRDVFLLTGRIPVNISKVLRGKISRVVTDCAEIDLYSSHAQVTQFDGEITEMGEFHGDLTSETIFGWDYINERLICTTPDQGYSYIFDFQSKSWYRITESYDYFVMTSNRFLGRSARGLVDLTNIEDDSLNIKLHFRTKPINLASNHRKKLEQSALRCIIQTVASTYAAFVLFASNDGEKWQFVTGNDRLTNEVNDIVISHTHASYKYFMFAFWGTVTPEYDHTISEIEIETKYRYLHNLKL